MVGGMQAGWEALAEFAGDSADSLGLWREFFAEGGFDEFGDCDAAIGRFGGGQSQELFVFDDEGHGTFIETLLGEGVVDVDVGLDFDGLAVQQGRLPLPLVHRFHRRTGEFGGGGHEECEA